MWSVRIFTTINYQNLQFQYSMYWTEVFTFTWLDIQVTSWVSLLPNLIKTYRCLLSIKIHIYMYIYKLTGNTRKIDISLYLWLHQMEYNNELLHKHHFQYPNYASIISVSNHNSNSLPIHEGMIIPWYNQGLMKRVHLDRPSYQSHTCFLSV